MWLHLWLALLVLATVAWIDHQIHRIPNRYLITAVVLHLSLWLVFDQAPELAVRECTLWIVTVMIMLSTSTGRAFFGEAIGMGDVKLIAYLLLFLAPHLSLSLWMVFIAAFSLVGVIPRLVAGVLRRERDLDRIAFAPILFFASLSALFGMSR